jgi:protein gp37
MKGLTPTKIEWCRDQEGRKGFTWNIVTGCKNGCSYCYARRLAEGRLKGRGRYVNGFEPTFHEDLLEVPKKLKRPSRIFISSMGEIWGPWVDRNWQALIMGYVHSASQHTFLNLTKNPQGMIEYSKHFGWPPNIWLGVSVTGDDDEGRLHDLAQVKHPNKFVSFEPLLADVVNNGWFTLEGIKWVIIGAQTGPGAEQPDWNWVADLQHRATGLNIPIFIKDNLDWPFEERQESPEGMP